MTDNLPKYIVQFSAVTAYFPLSYKETKQKFTSTYYLIHVQTWIKQSEGHYLEFPDWVFPILQFAAVANV